MPTKRPRIMFTPGEDTLIAIRRIADLEGKPMSAVVADFMDTVTPFMLDLVEAMEAAKAAKDEAKAGIVAAAEEAAETMRPHVDEVQQAFWKLLRAAQGDEPPSSNTGVTLGSNPPTEVR